MNSPDSSHLRGVPALAAWVTALLLFLASLVWLVSSGMRAGNADFISGMNGQDGTASLGQNDPGAVLGNLRAQDAAPVPVLSPSSSSASSSVHKDAAESEYVLSAAGLQGFYRSSAPDDLWTLDYAEPQIIAQLIRRGPPFPRLVTENVTVTWELASAKERGHSPAPRGRMLSVEDSWFQASIPLPGRREMSDPYQVVILRAMDKDGTPLAESAAVLATAPGFGCAHCHDNAGEAILEAHDRHQGTRFLERYAGGEIVACRSCHDGLTSTDKGEKAGRGMSVSAALHGWHAPYLTDMGANACMTCHIALGRAEKAPDEQPRPLFARDFHTERGIDCTRCHGVMEDHALALLKAEREAGQMPAAAAMAAIKPRFMPVADMDGRLPWIQEPDCTSCHDFMARPDLRTASAFNRWTPAAEGVGGLYAERRDDMLMVRCTTCHGAPHAVYPARNPLTENLDNIPPIQYQHLAAPFGSRKNCAVCHGRAMEYSAHHPLVEDGTAN